MPVAENAALLDHWPKLRQPRFALQRARIVPGPLKSLERRRRRPVWIAGFGLVGLSLAMTLLVAPQVRGGGTTMPRPIPAIAADPVRGTEEPVRIIGAAAPPQAAPVSEASTSRSALVPAPDATFPAEPRAPVHFDDMAGPPSSMPKAARPADLGPLPVLELDAAAFEAVTTPSVETVAPPSSRFGGRP